MNHPEHDKLVAIADGRQMEVFASDRWQKVDRDLALRAVASVPKEVRIAPEQPAPAKTVTVPLTDEQITDVGDSLFYGDRPSDHIAFGRAVIAEFCRINGITHAATAGREGG